jgi:hypothetical protein
MVTMRSGCFSAIISSEVSAEVVFSASMPSHSPARKGLFKA